MNEQDDKQSSTDQRSSRKTSTANQQHSKQVPAAQRPANDDTEAWKDFWEADITRQDVLISKDRVWDQLIELRKEIIELQKTRAQLIGFKITAVAGGLAVLSSLHSAIPLVLLLLPGFAAIFFDLLIAGQSMGIKRIGLYIATELEPFLKRSGAWPEGVLCWQEYVSRHSMNQSYSIFGNLGFTLIVVICTSVIFAVSSPIYESLPLILALLMLLTYDTIAYLRPNRVVEK